MKIGSRVLNLDQMTDCDYANDANGEPRLLVIFPAFSGDESNVTRLVGDEATALWRYIVSETVAKLSVTPGVPMPKLLTLECDGPD